MLQIYVLISKLIVNKISINFRDQQRLHRGINNYSINTALDTASSMNDSEAFFYRKNREVSFNFDN